MSNLQRMIVIQPEIFEKIKKILIEDSKLSELDKNMKSILRNNKLTDLNKWHLYRQNLLTYSSMKRKNAYKNKFNWYQPATRHLHDVEVQTKRIFPKNKETYIEPKYLKSKGSDNYTQTDIPKVKEEGHTDVNEKAKPIFTQIDPEEIFENNDEVFDDDDDDCIVSDEYINPIDILRERASSDSDMYRTFEMKDGATISVPTKKHILGKQKVLQPPKPVSTQSIWDLPKRKSERPLTVQAIKRSEKERLLNQQWTKMK